MAKKKQYTPEEIAQFKANTEEHMQFITAKLEEGVKAVFTSERFTEWLAYLGKFPTYSFRNQLLCMLQNPEANVFAGYVAWDKEFGRHVVKGQTGIWILAPCHKKFKEKDENGKEVEVTKLVGFKPVKVFGDNQTDGKPLPSICKPLEGDVANYDDLVQKVTKFAPCPVSYGKTGSAHGYFSPSENKIVIGEGQSQKQTLKTLIHETAHSILHCKGGEEETVNRRKMETEAEAVAYAVCSYLGIDTGDYSFEYLASWSSGKELKELQDTLEVIQKTACKFITAIA